MVQTIHYNQLNEAMNCKVSKTIHIIAGMAGTMYVGSDRYPVIITKVISPKKIMVAHMFDEHQDILVTNENGIQHLPDQYIVSYKNLNRYSFHYPKEYSLRKNGRWMPKGEGMWSTSSVHIGYADSYRDPSF